MAYTPSYSRRWIPDGPEGTRITLLTMRELARKDSLLPEVQQLAFWLGSPVAVESFLREHWVFRPDPPEAEYIEGAPYQLSQFWERGYFAGDCDDASTMAATLVHSIGWPCSFLAYRLPGASQFSHVNVLCPGALGYAADLEIDPVTPRDRLPIVEVDEVMEVHI